MNVLAEGTAGSERSTWISEGRQTAWCLPSRLLRHPSWLVKSPAVPFTHGPEALAATQARAELPPSSRSVLQ